MKMDKKYILHNIQDVITYLSPKLRLTKPV